MTTEAWLQQALGLHQAGQLAPARELYRRVLAAEPDNSHVLHLLGVAEHHLGQPAAGLAHLDRSLALDPQQPEGWLNRGNALMDLGRAEDAVQSYDRAIALRPDFADAHFSRANALMALGHPGDAVAAYDRTLAVQKDDFAAWASRGSALQALGRFSDAAESYVRALKFQPGLVDIHVLHGTVLQSLKDNTGAVAAYDAALRLQPDHVEALYNRGIALQSLERYEDAVASYDRVLSLRPEFPWAAGQLMRARLHLADWTDFVPRRDALLARLGQGRDLMAPVALQAISDDPALLRRATEAFVASECPASGPDIKPHPRDRLRIAYVSSDFWAHPVAQLAAPLFEHHDRAAFEVFAVSLGGRDDAWRDRIKGAADRFIDMAGQSDDDIIALLRRLEIDIAVDLNGYTENSRPRVFAARVAPVQVSHIGYAGTTGARFFDYLIADPVLVPPGDEAAFTEAIARIPSYQLNDDRLTAAPTPSRAEAGLPEQGFVFCAFHQAYKILPDVFDSWLRIMARVPESVLWLAGGNATAMRNLKAHAAGHGIDPERLIFAPRLPRLEDHLARHRLAGLFLDTCPYNAMVTASNALRMQVPVVTRRGQSFAARMGASLLTAVGMTDLITDTPQAYEALAVELATDPVGMAAVRARLADKLPACALFDARRNVLSLEAAYKAMYQRCRDGLPPAAITV